MRLQWDSRFFRGGAVWFERELDDDHDDEDGEMIVLDGGDLTVAGCGDGCSCEPVEEPADRSGFGFRA